MPDIQAEREGNSRGGTVYLKLPFDTACLIKRAIVKLVSRPESPLVPPMEESCLLALYDALDQVTAWPGTPWRSIAPDKWEDAGRSRAPEGAP